MSDTYNLKRLLKAVSNCNDKALKSLFLKYLDLNLFTLKELEAKYKDNPMGLAYLFLHNQDKEYPPLVYVDYYTLMGDDLDCYNINNIVQCFEEYFEENYNLFDDEDEIENQELRDLINKLEKENESHKT